MAVKRIQLTITGVVQGVWFRKSAREEATKLDLSGWIKNLDNGAVRAQAQGQQNDLEQFITWCYRGSSQAVVTGVEIENLHELTSGESGFTIIR